ADVGDSATRRGVGQAVHHGAPALQAAGTKRADRGINSDLVFLNPLLDFLLFSLERLSAFHRLLLLGLSGEIIGFGFATKLERGDATLGNPPHRSRQSVLLEQVLVAGQKLVDRLIGDAL